MKKNFKYVMMMAAALTLGFSSCSNDEDGSGIDDTPKNVTVSISAPSTYADEATAVGLTPTVHDAHVFFTDGITVKHAGTMNTAEVAGGKTFNNVPGSATQVIIIGNATNLSSPTGIAGIVDNDPISKVYALMFEQDKQTNPTSAVNVHGEAPIVGTAASVTLTPAIARIEIAKVEAKAGAAIPLTGFDLEAIYINNTYTKMAADYETAPTVAGEILNYKGSDPIWSGAAYPGRFKDDLNLSGSTSYTPAGKWSYYVMPIKAGNGTTIDGVQQSSVPHIVLKIKNATAAAGGPTFKTTMYVTIKDIEVGGAPLTELTKGKVFSIANIAIGGENLTVTPEVPAKTDISVTATVTPWVDQPVTPVIP